MQFNKILLRRLPTENEIERTKLEFTREHFPCYAVRVMFLLRVNFEYGSNLNIEKDVHRL